MAQVLCHLPTHTDPNVLVGMQTSDDAGVFRISDDVALVQTVDFITPIVDDPFVFGQVAAANALSDVYAMGGTPLTALNIVCFPSKDVPMEVLGQILAGGADKARQAGIEIIGGHSVDDSEPKYGMAVTGRVDPNRFYTNAGAQPGDRLILTKPIGSGILTTAIKKQELSQAGIDRVIETMTTLNRVAAECLSDFEIHAVTDVTGFGLLGHLYEMTTAAKLTANIFASQVPILDEAHDLALRKIVPGGAKRNLKRVHDAIEFESSLPEEWQQILADPQTSGGLLIAVAEADAERLQKRLSDVGTLAAAMVGNMEKVEPGRIVVHS